MELKDLVGEHGLSGVDMTTQNVKRWADDETGEEVNVCRFRLDGKTYAAVEDPDDGYRSSMSELVESAEPTTNEWPPVRVVCSMAPSGNYEQNEILEVRDAVTGGTVLRVGTGNTNDYYPYFVSEFDPKSLAHNTPASPPSAKGDAR